MKKITKAAILALVLVGMLSMSLPAMAYSGTQSPVIGYVTIHEVTKNGANLRAEPNADAQMVGYVPMKTSYVCLSKASNGWCEILLPSGATGYVSGKLVDFYAYNGYVQIYSYPIGTVTVNDTVYTYASTSFESDMMGKIFPGNAYPCVDAGIMGEWYCILVDHGDKGEWLVYVHNNDVNYQDNGNGNG